VYKYDLHLERPLMNAAGTLGYAPDRRQPVDWEQMGAFVTNPLSLEARTPARGPRCLPYPSGFLLHTGYPNPGLRATLRRYGARWASASLPVIVHLLAQHPDELAHAVRLLEPLDGIAALEIGLPPETDAASVVTFARAAQGELPVIYRLPFERALLIGEPLAASGDATVSLGPPRGALPSPGRGLVSGRLFGPGVLPHSLGLVRALAQLGLTVFGGGGIYSFADVEAMLVAGASAVQLDAVLWRGSFSAPG
jgi:dihydroorotate dehydrogenase (NAD+) catalytic subunit